MALLNEAKKVYVGEQAATALYIGVTRVWESVPVGPIGPTASLMTSYTPAADRNDFTGQVGVRLNILANRTVSWVGMRCGNGNMGIHQVKLFEWFADALLATANINMTGKPVGTFVWAPITPVALTPGYYAVLAEVVSGDGQQWSNNAPTTFSATDVGNVYATYRSPGGGMAVTGIDLQFVGVDLGW